MGAGTDGNLDTGPNDFYRFDPATYTWSPLGDFPGNPDQVRQFSSSFALNGKGYVYSGWHANGVDNLYNDFWEYDPVQDSWTERPGFEPIGRADAASFTIGTKGYVLTGYNNEPQWLSDVWEYDPAANSWEEKEPLPQDMERYSAFGFTIGNIGYVGLGFDNSFQIQNNLLEFNPSGNGGTGSWAIKTIFPNNMLEWPFAAATNDKAYVGLGLEYIDFFEFPTDNIWEYTPRHDE